MKKIINFFKAIGIIVLAGIIIGTIYLFSILGAVSLAVLLIYIGITEYHKKKPDKTDRP